MARPRQITDQQILDAMRDAVLDRGPAVPLDCVASKLGVTAPALLKRFGSRNALLLQALLPPENPEWRDEVRKGPTDEPLEVQLLAIFRRISAFLNELVPCVIALRESGVPCDPKALGGERGPATALRVLQGWLDAARDRGLITTDATETAAFSILGALNMRTFIAHLNKQAYSAESQEKYLVELAGLVSRALTAPGSKLPRARPPASNTAAVHPKGRRTNRARKPL